MGIENASTPTGKESSAGLHRATKDEERKVENRQGHELSKGADRFEERSKSSDGESAGSKQK